MLAIWAGAGSFLAKIRKKSPRYSNVSTAFTHFGQKTGLAPALARIFICLAFGIKTYQNQHNNLYYSYLIKNLKPKYLVFSDSLFYFASSNSKKKAFKSNINLTKYKP